jgi:hypothetical protein
MEQFLPAMTHTIWYFAEAKDPLPARPTTASAKRALQHGPRRRSLRRPHGSCSSRSGNRYTNVFAAVGRSTCQPLGDPGRPSDTVTDPNLTGMFRVHPSSGRSCRSGRAQAGPFVPESHVIPGDRRPRAPPPLSRETAEPTSQSQILARDPAGLWLASHARGRSFEASRAQESPAAPAGVSRSPRVRGCGIREQESFDHAEALEAVELRARRCRRRTSRSCVWVTKR